LGFSESLPNNSLKIAGISGSYRLATFHRGFSHNFYDLFRVKTVSPFAVAGQVVNWSGTFNFNFLLLQICLRTVKTGAPKRRKVWPGVSLSHLLFHCVPIFWSCGLQTVRLFEYSHEMVFSVSFSAPRLLGFWIWSTFIGLATNFYCPSVVLAKRSICLWGSPLLLGKLKKSLCIPCAWGLITLPGIRHRKSRIGNQTPTFQVRDAFFTRCSDSNRLAVLG